MIHALLHAGADTQPVDGAKHGRAALRRTNADDSFELVLHAGLSVDCEAAQIAANNLLAHAMTQDTAKSDKGNR